MDRYRPSYGQGDKYAPCGGGNASNRSTTVADASSYRRVLPRRLFQRGLIIRGPLHEQDYQGAAEQSTFTVADKNVTDSRFGPIYTKVRKMIVVECYADHYIAVPCFTHNGHGLTKVRKLGN